MSKQDNSLFTRDNLFDLKGKVALVTGKTPFSFTFFSCNSS